MVSELLCLEILRFMLSRTLTLTQTVADTTTTKSTNENAASDADIYGQFLSNFSLVEIDTAMKWLELRHYIGQGSATFRGPFWRFLTEKGLMVTQVGFSKDEKKLFYPQEEPYVTFVAHQFNRDDSDLVAYLRDKVLTPNGFKMMDGRPDGLEDFRTAILGKIRRSRFFLCLLTKRTALATGTFASSVWLYQETGVAVAFGKKPLLLVEEGIDSEYVGELQRIYEYIVFTRSNHPDRFDEVRRRLLADLQASGIPSP